MKPLQIVATLALLVLSGKAAAHEFWIDAAEYEIEVGDTLIAHLRVGEEYVGSSMSYLPRNFTTFDVMSGDAALPVDGRFGDIPALAMADMPEGLAVVVHETTANQIVWSEWERFLNFANHKDMGDVTALHTERGLSQENVRENFIRYAKALIAVGDGEGTDQRVGLRAELVALANPYTDDLSGEMPMQLWYDDAIVPDYQVELFAMNADGEVSITLHRTDAEGVVALPVEPGVTYMADSVFLEALEPASETDPVWVTHWANTTFAVPQ